MERASLAEKHHFLTLRNIKVNDVNKTEKKTTRQSEIERAYQRPHIIKVHNGLGYRTANFATDADLTASGNIAIGLWYRTFARTRLFYPRSLPMCRDFVGFHPSHAVVDFNIWFKQLTRGSNLHCVSLHFAIIVFLIQKHTQKTTNEWTHTPVPTV